MKYDALLSGGTIVDPKNCRHKTADLAVVDGHIAEIGAELDARRAARVFDVEGLVVIPGIIDMHVHTSRRHKGHNAHTMMAKAGVVTALDLGGPLEEFLEFCHTSAAGLNMAVLQQVRPGSTVGSDDPGRSEITDLLEKSVTEGALGLKLLGGHYPLTPEATKRTIQICNQHSRYVAFHSGTTRTPGNIDGFLESVQLAEDLRLHIPHINSYCRGGVRGALQETYEALGALTGRDNLFTESYLAIINGTSGRCSDGVPESLATQRCLQERSYPPTREGLRRAILEGYARVGVQWGGVNTNITGEEAVRAWEEQDTAVSVNFPVNAPEARFACAVARDDRGRFIVDAISTDGGGHPRNVAVEYGLSLVKAEGLTLDQFVQKTSWIPAEILGLTNKGHLAPGADGDITVVDPERCRPVMSFNRGKLIMHHGAVLGDDTTVITTEQGARQIHKRGLSTYTIDIEDGLFYAEDPCPKADGR